MRRQIKPRQHASSHMPHDTVLNSISFTDAQIITIYDMLLKPGIYYWKMPDLKTGRNILWSFLQSLDYYDDIACISYNQDPLPLTVLPLVEYWQMTGYLDCAQQELLCSYFTQEWSHDFIWIEYDQALSNAPWLAQVEQQLQERSLDVCVVYITYE